MLRPAVFFDRYGVLNVHSEYLFEIDKLSWIDGAIEAVKATNEARYFAFVINNQQGVTRGFYHEAEICRLHFWMAEQLMACDARIDAFGILPDSSERTVTPLTAQQ
ncbi:hypothetical protein [Bradyrhizobium sp. 44]|uniref:hypothetical protein n=1 Tax=Bradyrhizobium sp. 44 TaxID=2782675 RepID=UPI001FFB56AD|nr:hypothetical protein [Bradyrhizobium sp. 44]